LGKNQDLKMSFTGGARALFNQALKLLKVLEKADNEGNLKFSDFFSNGTKQKIQELESQNFLQETYKNPLAHIYLDNIGKLYLLLNQDKEAYQYFKKALDFNPSYTTAHENIAFLLLSMGDCATANRHMGIAKELQARKQNPRKQQLEVNLASIILEENENKKILKSYLEQGKNIVDGKTSQLVILRRWNSFTPAIPGKPKSLGGGYFLNVCGQGFVIDPGYDFLANFAKAGFSLADINSIFISHLHADHIGDLEDIIFLLREKSKRCGLTTQEINIVSSENIIKKLQKRIGVFGGEVTENINFLSIKSNNKININNVNFEFTPTYHEKHKNHNKHNKHNKKDNCNTGFTLEFPKFKVGYTSDTRWNKKLLKHFENCDIILAHLGELYPDDITKTGEIPENEGDIDLTKRRHLGLFGIYKLIKSLKNPPKLLLVSEFGEELGIFRTAVTRKLNDEFFKQDIKTLALAADIGLRVRFEEQNQEISIFCQACGIHGFRSYEEINEIALEKESDSQILYYCQRHTENVIREKFN